MGTLKRLVFSAAGKPQTQGKHRFLEGRGTADAVPTGLLPKVLLSGALALI